MIAPAPPPSAAFGRSLHLTAAASDARALLNITGTAAEWNAKQTYRANNSSDDALFCIAPDPTDDENEDYNFGARSFDFGSYQNFVVYHGHNVNAAGVPVNALKPMLAHGMESSFDIAGEQGMEGHGWVFKAPGRAVQRVMTTFLGFEEAAPSRNGNQLGFNIQQFYVNDGLSTNRRLTIDETGFAITNVPVSISQTTTTFNGLSINLPTGTTGNFLSLAYNSGLFASIDRHGCTFFGGSGQAGASARNAVLTAQGRALTANAFEILSVAGANRFQAAGDGSYLIQSAPTFYNRGSDLLIQDSSNVTQFAVLNSNGRIRTNQVTAGTTLGAVVGGWRIETTGGVLIGYAGVYASISA